MLFFHTPVLSFLRATGAWSHPVKSPASKTACAEGARYEKTILCFATLGFGMMVPLISVHFETAPGLINGQDDFPLYGVMTP
jgi:hypothetical protein